MIFGGIHKVSLMDYPGKVAAVVFTVGCNFRCPYCHNPELVPARPKAEVPEEAVLDFLERRRGKLDGVVVTGGEPTLQPDLPRFLADLKEMGFAVKLDTNGSRPGVLAGLFRRKLVDYVAMDAKTAPSLYRSLLGASVPAADLAESARLVKESGLDHEFRTTCAPLLVNEETIREMGETLSGARLWIFQKMNGGRMLMPDFLERHPGPPGPESLSRFARLAASYVRRALVRA